MLRHQKKLVCCFCYAEITIRLVSTCRGTQSIQYLNATLQDHIYELD